VDHHAQLALLRQQFEQLIALRDPAQVDTWQPTTEQRLVYARLLDQILNGLDAYQTAEKRQILREGTVQIDVSDSAFLFYRTQLEPRVPELKRAYEIIDADGAELYHMLEGIGAPSGAGGGIKRTFDEGLQQIYSLIDRNPDMDFHLLPDTAYEVIDSKLIAFDPDSWLDRVGQLAPVRTARKNVLLPVHVRLRLEELFRAYIFGCWLSVLALSRATLEYAILDNLHKFGVDAYWPPDRNDKRSEKKLEHLIEAVGNFLPQLVDPMDRLGRYGNEYLHPKTSKSSKETLFQRENAAKDAVEKLTFVVEALYPGTSTECLTSVYGLPPRSKRLIASCDKGR